MTEKIEIHDVVEARGKAGVRPKCKMTIGSDELNERSCQKRGDSCLG